MKKWFLFLLVFSAVLAQPCAAEQENTVLPIVMYHHISKSPSKWNDYVVSVSEFEQDMAYLQKNGWHSVSVAELEAWSRGEGGLPEKAFVLTFDDGFESTLAYAEPILQKYGFCGAVAVIGSVCERFSKLDEHYPELSNMSWEEAAEMADRGVIEVQCHTWDMHALAARRGCNKKRGEGTEAYDAVLRADIQKFLDAAQENGVNLTMAFAYPYGEYCEQAESIIKDMGFIASFTCDERINVIERSPEALFRLARFNRPHGVSSERFFKKWEAALDNGG